MAKSPSYLPPNRNSLQKPIGGRSKNPKRSRSVLAFFEYISMLKISALNKGRGVTQEQASVLAAGFAKLL